MRNSYINEMMKDGLVIKDSQRLVVNHAMKDTLNNFINFLVESGEFDKNDKFNKNIQETLKRVNEQRIDEIIKSTAPNPS